MGVLISSSDFVGRFAIPQTSFSVLDSFINDTEEAYLIDLFGFDFYQEFKADLSAGVPQTARYLILFNELNFDYSYSVFKSKGLKEMLKCFIYFDYMRNVKFKATTQGVVVNSSDTSQNVVVGNLYNYLNEAINIANAIQTYIVLKNPNDYNQVGMPVFNGYSKNQSIPIF